MQKPRFATAAVVGVGLIGGSVARAMRSRGLAGRVVGVTSTPTRAEELGRLGIVDQATDDLVVGVEAAEMVVVCTPVDRIAARVVAASQAAPEAILTDAGSTKAGILDDVEQRLAHPGRFVAAHPLAGGHQTGPEAARQDLFDGATTIVTPTDRTDPGALTAVRELWVALGSSVVEMPPDEHDRVVAATSHLPHVAAAAVAACTPAEAVRFAATGWADTTRVAAGSPSLWRAILLANRTAVAVELDKLADRLAAYRSALADADGERIEALLAEGSRRRDAVGD